MRINLINPYILNKRLLNNSQQKECKKTFTDIPLCKPFIKSTNDSVSFGNVGTTSMTGLFKLLDRPYIPCPYCGKIMVTPNEFSTKLKGRVLSGTSRHAIRILSHFKDNMHEIEALCFKKIKEISKQTPHKSLHEILMDLRPESLKKLAIKQFDVLNKIDNLGESLSTFSKTELLETTQKARNQINTNNNEIPFARQLFIEAILEFKKGVDEKAIGEKIYQAALKFPNSTNNLDAFIVKYSLKRSEQIGQRLVSTAVASLEHIKPQSDFKRDKHLLENGIIASKGLNNARCSMPFDEWIKLHPETLRNSQKYIDTVITIINKDKNSKYANYPIEVAEVLKEASKGAIVLDTSRLRIKGEVYDMSPLIEKFNSRSFITQGTATA